MDERQLLEQISHQSGLKPTAVAATVRLLDGGNTVPFITRYRKHQTGGLDETQVRLIQEQIIRLREVASQRERMLATLNEQGKLTAELAAAFAAADSKRRLDEIFAPFRARKKSKAMDALERGLGPLADAIWSGRVGDHDISRVAANCVGKHPDLTDADAVTIGALEIIAARIAESIPVRDTVRNLAWQTGKCSTSFVKQIKDEKDRQTFQDYAAFESSVARLPPHRILAIDRGEAKKVLRVSINWKDAQAERKAAALLQFGNHRAQSFLFNCLKEALKRFINPAIDREIRRNLTEQAQQHAIIVFGTNLRSLLMQPPLKQQRVLAIDPGFRTGCKLAALDEHGNLLANDVVFVIGNHSQISQREKLARFVQDHRCDVIAIGNGTASRESEGLVAETIREFELPCQYTIVNEAGASIYSASAVGREELPDQDATVRGTVSIGRRLQDPLSELVKIEPHHLGVGMYQHDVSETQLSDSLDAIVESCVNSVGIDLNRASEELLKYVSGFNRKIARNVVAWRSENGPFRSRQGLREVPGIGETTFTQAAGFLRIPSGGEPLDATWIHPESYPLARGIMQACGIDTGSVSLGNLAVKVQELLAHSKLTDLAVRHSADCVVVQEVLDALLKPERDPRDDVSGPLFRTGVLTFEDLRPEMQLRGVVTNVVDFGAFVDVGLKNDGLIHISKMSTSFVSAPYDIVHVGDIVTVWVDQLDEVRKRIGLSLIAPDAK